jgi:hypothetical protein
MEMQEWKDLIIDKAKRQITYRNNMSSSDIQELTLVLSDYLDEGISILRKWRKIKDDSAFLSKEYDSGLVLFVKEKYQANGRDLFSGYSSGGVSATMKVSPENTLKGTYKQVM